MPLPLAWPSGVLNKMIEIIPKPAAKLPLWQNILFYSFLALLLLTILSYFILDFSLKKAETTLKNLEETLAQERTTEEITLEKEVFSYQKKIGDFSKLLKGHLFSSKIFEFIEKNSHPKIWFSQLNLNPREGEVNLSGQAENFTTLHQQLQILKANPKVLNLNLVQIAIGKGGRVDFGLNITLDPSVFK